jgi:hypothetical protein
VDAGEDLRALGKEAANLVGNLIAAVGKTISRCS